MSCPCRNACCSMPSVIREIEGPGEYAHVCRNCGDSCHCESIAALRDGGKADAPPSPETLQRQVRMERTVRMVRGTRMGGA